MPRYTFDAVHRNRVKRRLREIVRVHVLPALQGVDVTVRALPSAYRADFGELREQCLRVRDRLLGARDP